MQNLTILVVEDEADIRDMVTLVIENANMTAIAAATAEQAQKALEDSNIDLLLLEDRKSVV